MDEKTAEEVERLLLSLVKPESVLIVATHDERLASKMDAIIDMVAFK